MKIVGTYTLSEHEVGFYKQHSSFLTDGRHIGRVGEDWVSVFFEGVRQPENSPFDVLSKDGVRIEVRSAIKKVSFASSKEVGYGRKVTDKGFQEKLDNIDVFIIIDSREINKGYIKLVEINKNDIVTLSLGKNKGMSAKKFWKEIDTWK